MNLDQVIILKHPRETHFKIVSYLWLPLQHRSFKYQIFISKKKKKRHKVSSNKSRVTPCVKHLFGIHFHMSRNWILTSGARPQGQSKSRSTVELGHSERCLGNTDWTAQRMAWVRVKMLWGTLSLSDAVRICESPPTVWGRRSHWGSDCRTRPWALALQKGAWRGIWNS